MGWRQVSGTGGPSRSPSIHTWRSPEDHPITEPNDRPTREDAVYASLFAFLRRYGFWIAVAAPLVLVSQVVHGELVVLLVVLIWLGEAIVYAAVQRRGRARRSGPGPGLVTLWVGLASLLILGGLFGLAAGGGIIAAGALVLGLAIVALMWHRVVRASGEDPRAFASRIAGTIAITAREVAGFVAIAGIAALAAAIGLPVIVVGLVAVVALATLVAWTLSKTLR